MPRPVLSIPPPSKAERFNATAKNKNINNFTFFIVYPPYLSSLGIILANRLIAVNGVIYEDGTVLWGISFIVLSCLKA